MARYAITITVIITTTLLAGCNGGAEGGSSSGLASLLVPESGTRRPLTTENYPVAFGQARSVMSQYFTVASADSDSGVIVCEPKAMSNAPGDRLIGRSEARQAASMKISRTGGRIYAVCTVELQRQGAVILRQQSITEDTYSSVPNQTPAEMDAATSPQQNDAWETYATDGVLENKILNDLEQALTK